MKKLIICLVGLVALVGSVIFWLAEAPLRTRPVTSADAYRATVKPGPAAPATPKQAMFVALPMNRTVRLAVGGLGFRDDEANRQLGDLVTVKVTGSPGFELVERQSLAKILSELNLSWSGFVRAKDIVHAGKLLKADWFLVGTEAKINETNSLVVRVVDARTGVMRDAGVFPVDQPLTQLAADLAGFLRQSRTDAATTKMRTYLAIGAFDDVSVNNRQADFPAQIRGYLTAAYRGSGVTLLEREYVETLLQEVHLDMAGLTEEGGQNAPAPMQSAFWLVNGEYQSYETTNFQVEVNLEVHRVFGRSWRNTLRGLPGEPIGRKIKTATDEVMNHNSDVLTPTRASEARLQIYIGQDVIETTDFGASAGFGHPDLVWVPQNWGLSPQQAARQKRKLDEAMHAFEAALLLEPTNRQAKMYMALCARDPVVFRLNEACNYYREIIDDPVQDKWTRLAQQALNATLLYSSPDERLRWLQAAAERTTNVAAAQFYKQQAEEAQGDATLSAGNSPAADRLAEQRLLADIQSAEDFVHHKFPASLKTEMGIRDYVESLNLDATNAARRLVELLPNMKQQAPDLEPYFVTFVLTHQLDTNTPLIADFERVLKNFIEFPDRVPNAAQFRIDINSVYYWSQEKSNYSLAIKIKEYEQETDSQAPGGDGEQDKIDLAYLYLAVDRWQDALKVFESFDNRPVKASHSGPWGEAFKIILTEKMASRCREHLGLTSDKDPRKFEMGKPVMCLCSPGTFASDDDGLWVGIGGRLMHLDFELKTNMDVSLPIDAFVPVTAVCLASDKVWIGTGGAGLIEFDKVSRKCRRLTEADGLMMNDLASLEMAGDSLWIGYGGATGGGLGRMDLRSRKLSSFMPSLDDRDPSRAMVGQTPPRAAIGKIVAGSDGDLWMQVGRTLQQYGVARSIWETVPTESGEWVSCFSADSTCLAEGGGINLVEIGIQDMPKRYGPTNDFHKTNMVVSSAELSQLQHELRTNGSHRYVSSSAVGGVRPKGVLVIQDLRDHHRQTLQDADAIPNPPSTMTLAGNDLWVGGEGAIALVDVAAGKVKKYCHIQAQSVDRIQVAGGYIWAQFDWHLYRIALSEFK